MTEASKMKTSPKGSLPSSTPPKTTTPTAANSSLRTLFRHSPLAMDLMRLWIYAGMNLPDGEPGSSEEVALRAEHVARFKAKREEFPI